ncbi:hypothetical protein BRADI_1g15345v3 [Brachypodium distachyon]|uniref:Reverse transcriptase zinc-binding domain-containing protein n=1 Tax=Brachypodium distachyon TaxID=15368 RepID=A0A2K2DJM5_BRADI|nr:hypothetical protein BRADI_1g15345v3 [Brachypodium distachyon]
MFCSEPETIQHLFFDCLVATLIWEFMSLLLGKNLGSSLEQIAHFWVGNRKNEVLNMATAAVLWSLWKCRNNIFFRSSAWSSMHVIWRMVLRHLRSWKHLCSNANQDVLAHMLRRLEDKSVEIPRLRLR